MSTSLMDDIAAAPDVAPDDLFGAPVMEAVSSSTETVESPKRTRQRGRPRKPRPVDPETGEEIEAPRRKYTPRTGKLEEELLDEIVSLASDLSAFAPTAAGVLIVRAEAASKGMVALAKNSPRTMAALQKASQAGNAFGLLSIAAMLAVALAVDLGRLSPESPILDHIGYAEVQRDENGKMRRGEDGKAVKERMTLREIRAQMIGEDAAAAEVAPEMVPEWTPDIGQQIFTPPMNWIP